MYNKEVMSFNIGCIVVAAIFLQSLLQRCSCLSVYVWIRIRIRCIRPGPTLRPQDCIHCFVMMMTKQESLAEEHCSLNTLH